MNYEELYSALLPLEKELKSAAGQAASASKAVEKNAAKGELKDLEKQLTTLEGAISRLSDAAAQVRAQVEGFDAAQYIRSGDFAAQMEALCRERNIDVHKDDPVYEMFPYQVRFTVTEQTAEVNFNRKKYTGSRPLALVEEIEKGQQKLASASFNADEFGAELYAAYEIASMKSGRKTASYISLYTLYMIMAPMKRFRKAYDYLAYAYDIARLYNAKVDVLKNGMSVDFGTSRSSGKPVRILNANGKEEFIYTVMFFDRNKA